MCNCTLAEVLENGGDVQGHGIYARDENGAIRAQLILTAGGSTVVEVYAPDGTSLLGRLELDAVGGVSVANGAAAQLSLNADGSIVLQSPNGRLEIAVSGLISLPDLPTTDPAIPGALYNDAGTLKVSAG